MDASFGRTVAALFCFSPLTWNPALAAAQTVTFAGEVVDVEGKPVEAALILTHGGTRVWSDIQGQFTLIFPAGEDEFAIVTPWCTVSKAPLPRASSEFVLQFQVEADRRTGERGRSKGSQAKIITAEQMADMRVRSLADVLERVAPDMVSARQGDRVRLSGRSGTLQGQTRPVIVMDGIVLGESASSLLTSIRPEDIAYLEIQKGASGGWEYGTGGSGGVVRIVSKTGSFGNEAGFEAGRCRNLNEIWPE